MNKSQLLFVIEDRNNNKFGGYLTSTISGVNTWITDYNSFSFSLKSNGNINGMQKFEIQSNCAGNAFFMWQKSYNNLFSMGCSNHVHVYKENDKTRSCCSNNNSYNFHGIQNGPRGTSGNFTPKRITVIQMK